MQIQSQAGSSSDTPTGLRIVARGMLRAEDCTRCKALVPDLRYEVEVKGEALPGVDIRSSSNPLTLAGLWCRECCQREGLLW